MAEIKIEKKKPVWPWIVAALLIVGLVYYIFLSDDQVRSESNTEIENSTSADTIAQ